MGLKSLPGFPWSGWVGFLILLLDAMFILKRRDQLELRYLLFIKINILIIHCIVLMLFRYIIF